MLMIAIGVFLSRALGVPQTPPPAPEPGSALLTEDGDRLTDETGLVLTTE